MKDGALSITVFYRRYTSDVYQYKQESQLPMTDPRDAEA